jgi:hypothetical protein|tara:strand:+ start:273 stop:593 length:321 start_codon:yes stop_codon:yes gene_type:complete
MAGCTAGCSECALSVDERFWNMDNRFWIIFDTAFKVGELDVSEETVVIGFMAKKELCCDSAELGMDHPVQEVDEDELFSILGAEDQVLLWDLHTRDSVLMKKKVSA